LNRSQAGAERPERNCSVNYCVSIEGIGHQNGTSRMGSDLPSSLLDQRREAHDLDNHCVVDASCFVSAYAADPSLTIRANAIRIANHLLADRLK
jgi:choline dehydrogenase-like flavoprotein